MLVKRRLEFVSATDSYSCGAAALAAVARYYGHHILVEELRQRLGTTKQGTTLFSLKQVAEQLGFEAACGRAKRDALESLSLPVIAHVRSSTNGHLVVITHVGRKRLKLSDPAQGFTMLSRREFDDLWTGYVLLLKPGRNFTTNTSPPSIGSELFALTIRRRRALLISVALALLVVVLGFTLSLVTARIMDNVLPHNNIWALELMAGAAALLLCLRALSHLARRITIAQMNSDINNHLCLPLLHHAIHLPLAFHDQRSVGDTFSRANDVVRISSAVTGAIITTIPDVVFMIASAVVLWLCNSTLTATLLLFIPPAIVVVWAASPYMASRERRIREAASEWTSGVIDVLRNIRTIKAFASETSGYDKAIGSYSGLQRLLRESAIITDLTSAATSLLVGSASLALLVVGSKAVIKGSTSVGTMLLFASVSGLIMGAIDHLSPSMRMLQEAMTALERLREIRGLQSDLDRDGNLPRPDRELSGQIRFKDVRFGYTNDKPVLNSFSLLVQPGQWLVIFGETGSGKTTIANLLLGLYLPISGEVFFDDFPISQINRQAVRRDIAVVFQEAGLMNGSIRDNIGWGIADADEAAIIEAAKLACIHEFIMSLPRGYSHLIGESGCLLSAGQKQRIAIARAILRNAPILILDEATSNLDVHTERRILDNLKRERRDRTTIVISHRVQSGLIADEIVVIDKGDIVEKGSHEELLSAGGRYCTLWSAASPGHKVAAPQVCGTLEGIYAGRK